MAKDLLGMLKLKLDLKGADTSKDDIESLVSSMSSFNDGLREAKSEAIVAANAISILADNKHAMAGALLETQIQYKKLYPQLSGMFAIEQTAAEMRAAKLESGVALAKEMASQYATLALETPESERSDKQKESLKTLEQQMQQYSNIADEKKLINIESEKFDKHLQFVASGGIAAYNGISSAITGVTDAQNDVKIGMDALKGTFSTFGRIAGKTIKLLGGEEMLKGKKSAMQRALFGDSDERTAVNRIQDAFLRISNLSSSGTTTKSPSPLMATKGAPTGGGLVTGKIGGMQKAIGKLKQMRGIQKIMGGEAVQASKAIKGLGTSSNIASKGISGVSGQAGLFGNIARSVGPAVSQLTTAIVAGGPVAWIAAAAAVVALAAAVLTLGVALKFMWEGMKLVIKDMEALRLVNYRALGSIHELTSASYDVGAATGLSTQQSLAAIKALSEVGITSAELTKQYGNSGQALRKLAIMQGTFIRMTGASGSTVAQLQKRLMVGGVTMASMQRTLDKTSNSMKKYGITGKNADEFMAGLSESLKIMNVIYEESEINTYIDSMAGLAAAAKRAGIEMSVVKKIDGELRGLKGGAMMLIALGGHMNELIQQGAAAGNISNLMDGYAEVERMVGNLPKGLREVAMIKMGLDLDTIAMLDAEKVRREGITKQLREQGFEGERLKVAMKELLAEESKTAALRQSALDDYSESLGTLTQQMQQMFAPIQAKAAKAVQPLIEGLVAFIKRFGPIFTDVIGSAIDFIAAAATGLAMGWMVLMPIIEVIGSVIGWVISLAFKLGTVFMKVVTILLSPLYVLYVMLKALAKPIIFVGQLLHDVFGGALDDISCALDGVMSFGALLIDTLAPILEVLAVLFLVAFAPVLIPILAIAGAVHLVCKWLKHLWSLVGGPIVKAFQSARKSFKEFIQPITNAVESVKAAFADLGSLISDLPSIFEKSFDSIGDIVKDKLSYLTPMLRLLNMAGGKSETSTTMLSVAAKQQIASDGPLTGVSTPIYTSQFDESSKRSQNERQNDLVMLQSQTVSTLEKILEKSDPDNKRAAEAMEKVAVACSESGTEPEIFRSRKGFGEHVVHWWISK